MSWRRVGVLAVVIGAATACASSDGSDGAGSAATTASGTVLASAPATATAPAVSTTGTAEAPVVPAALAFAAPTVGGGQLDLAGYAGSNVALWFWAPY